MLMSGSGPGAAELVAHAARRNSAVKVKAVRMIRFSKNSDGERFRPPSGCHNELVKLFHFT
jgi:hypothetical protein